MWLVEFPTTPFLGAVSDLFQTRGGPSGRLVGVCTPRGAMRWIALAVLQAYSRYGPHVPASWSISVCWAALRCVVNIRAFQRSAPSKGHAGGRLYRGLWVPCTVWLLVTLRRVFGVQGAKCSLCSPV